MDEDYYDKNFSYHLNEDGVIEVDSYMYGDIKEESACVAYDDYGDRSLRERLIFLLAPIAAGAGATTVESIINTAVKLEGYIKTGINPLEPMIAGYDLNHGPLHSDTFEMELDETIVVDENGVLQAA